MRFESLPKHEVAIKHDVTASTCSGTSMRWMLGTEMSLALGDGLLENMR